MENFAKSILNYFAAYTETRFRFDKKIDYFWTDNELTCDLSVFPDFQSKLLEQIQSGTPFNFYIAKGEYSIELEEDKFRKTLLESLNGAYGIDFLKNCIKQELENYKKQYGDKIILIGDNNDERNETNRNHDNSIPLPKEYQKKCFLEGIRKYNNAFADGVINLLTKLQVEKLNKLKAKLNINQIPPSTFNPHQIRQQIFNGFQKITITQDIKKEEQYFESISQFIKDENFNLVLFDLYAILRQFKSYIPAGNLYLFFHEMIKTESESENNKSNTKTNNSNNKRRKNNKYPISKYPIFLVETNIEEKEEEIHIQSARDIVIINTPAINY